MCGISTLSAEKKRRNSHGDDICVFGGVLLGGILGIVTAALIIANGRDDE